MKEEYIITNEELQPKGLDLTEYTLEGTNIIAIINIALDLAITQCLKMNDNFKYSKDIEKALDDNQDLVESFKKLQFRVIYNLLFVGDVDPIDKVVENIITFDLRWGKINGFQKGYFSR